MLEYIEKCEICPHKCKVNRINGNIGRCKSKDTVKVALASIHNFEEPCISGENGSGTIFFSNCNMNCVYCQNYEISQQGLGKEITIQRLAEIFIEQQEKGLKLPIVYNTNAYESVETLKMLEGYIDIYLPDLKYANNHIAKHFSKVENYFETATKAIKEMYRQVGECTFDNRGIMKKGVIIRHLVLPNNIENSKKVLKWIEQNMSHNIFVSIMAQYFPTYKTKEIEDLNRKLTKEEYNEIEQYLYGLKLENGYIQELGEHEEEYVPQWILNV